MIDRDVENELERWLYTNGVSGKAPAFYSVIRAARYKNWYASY